MSRPLPDPTRVGEALLPTRRGPQHLASVFGGDGHEPPHLGLIGGSSGGGGMLSDFAGSPISLMAPSMPAGERMNNSLAGPESTAKAWGMSLGPKRYEPGRAFIVCSPT